MIMWKTQNYKRDPLQKLCEKQKKKLLSRKKDLLSLNSKESKVDFTTSQLPGPGKTISYAIKILPTSNAANLLHQIHHISHLSKHLPVQSQQ